MFYVSFLREYRDWYNLSINEQIVYSALLGKAIMEIDCVFDCDGVFDQNILDAALERDTRLELFRIPYTKISEMTGIAISSLYGRKGIIQRLINTGLLCEEYADSWSIYVEKPIIERGYFKLRFESGLKEKQLVFFTFLVERLLHHNISIAKKTNDKRWLKNNAIDTWAYRLAEDFGTTKNAIRHLMVQLQKNGMAKRSKNNKLLYLNIDTMRVMKERNLT